MKKLILFLLALMIIPSTLAAVYPVNDTYDWDRAITWAGQSTTNATGWGSYGINYTMNIIPNLYFNGTVNNVSFDTHGIPGFSASIQARFHYINGTFATNTTDDIGNIGGYVNRNLTNPYPNMPVWRIEFQAVGTNRDVAYIRNIYFQVNYTIPVVLNAPVNGTTTSSSNLLFNATGSVLQGFNTNLTNATLFIWNNAGSIVNQTKNTILGNTTNTTTWNVTMGSIGTYYWNVNVCYQNSTTTNCKFALSNSTFMYGYAINSETWVNTTTETAYNNFSLNISVPSTITFAQAVLYYNNTNYSADTITQGNNRIFTARIAAPAITNATNVSFNWIISLSDGAGSANFYTNTHNQTINLIGNLQVSTNCNDRAYQFTFADEENLSTLNGSINYNVAFGIDNGTAKRIYGNITNTNVFYICINSTISQNWTIGDGQLFYTHPSGSYVDRRYYLFQNQRVTNATNNVTLYQLLSASQTSFQLTIESTSLDPYDDKYSAILRWYPNLNEYRIVDMGLTDETGSTAIHVVAEDVDYRIGVYEKNGTLIKLANPIRMVCISTPCTYTLFVSPSDSDFTSFFDVTGSLTYNETTGIWSFIYSDSSQRTSLMNMTIYRDTSTTSFPVCASSSTSFAGVLTCNTSIYSTGRLRAVVLRSASPPIIVANQIIDLISSPFTSTFGLFLSLILFAPIVFIFAMISPFAALVGGIIALIPAFKLGSVTWTVLGGFAVLSAIVAHFIKRIQ